MWTLAWPLAQMVCQLKTVVEQDSIKSLNENITFGTEKHTLSLVTWLGGDLSPEILQKLTSCLTEWTKQLHCNWLEDALILQTRIFGDFELSRTFRCCAGLPCRCCHILISHSTYDHTYIRTYVRLRPFQGTSVRPSGRLPSDRTKPRGSLGQRWRHQQPDHSMLVPCYFSWSLSTYEAVKTMCVNQRPTVAVVRRRWPYPAERWLQYPHCLVVSTTTTRG